jgi:ribulose-phosphate 3-epimerase
MSTICPTILARNLPEYNSGLEKIQDFAERIQIDLADGDFAPTRTINLIEAHWPPHIRADFHLMLRDPLKEIETIIAQHPSLVILHAESQHVKEVIDELSAVRIRTGIAILPETSVESAQPLIELSEHVLIFGGHLGYYGGDADLAQLAKVKDIRAIRKDMEIGWDGGANDQTVRQLAEGGIDVINVGGYIQNAPEPEASYRHLLSLLPQPA